MTPVSQRAQQAQVEQTFADVESVKKVVLETIEARPGISLRELRQAVSSGGPWNDQVIREAVWELIDDGSVLLQEDRSVAVG